MEEHWEFILEEEKGLRNLCRIMCRGRYDLQDEAFSEVCSRMPGIFRTYDPFHPSGASIKTHAYNNARGYLFKFYTGKDANGPRQEYEWLSIEEHEVDVGRFLDLDTPSEVSTILDQMSEYERTLLVLYHCWEFTYQEIADRLGVAKGTARNHHRAALARAQHIAQELMNVQ